MLSAATKWVTTTPSSSEPKTEMGPPSSRGTVLRVHESFLRSLKRRSLRVKRSKSLVIAEKRKSGNTEIIYRNNNVI
ncbi:centaurin-gamma-1A isoform X1 [Aphis craccivora]|uniref:Centaurin-gamma-1A isoform X1 n=1 Tax=Aphis craccivora TaxID=307492 RepID=A0A6G0ZKJ8_APHCR|nr:centaurin-gamma-1A isoform X1 [Aphis craccivora]